MKTETFIYDNNEYIIQIGKNKNENWELIDNASNTDVWFHIEGQASCHVVLKNEDLIKNIPRQVIKRCAYLCKINSAAKTMSKCNVNYAPILSVIKTDIVGQVNVQSCKTVST
jgi:predicted ribosome quality control (RQC) complex YloA/Tae2 family protein